MARRLFSERLQDRKGPQPLSYDVPPGTLFRKQVADIILRLVGPWVMDEDQYTLAGSNFVWKHVRGEVNRRHLNFPYSPYRSGPADDCVRAVLEGDKEMMLDVVEEVFAMRQVLDGAGRHNPYQDAFAIQRYGGRLDQITTVCAIEEFNQYAARNGVGYQFAGGMIVESGSNYTTGQLIEPSLILLHDKEYEGAHEEFKGALNHFRQGQYKDAITNAGKAFESVMKTICARNGWKGEKRGQEVEAEVLQVYDLIQLLKAKGFFPRFLDNTMSDLANLLGSLSQGPTIVRNKRSAHGQGEEVVEVSRELAEYAIHTTASNILFFASLAEGGK